MQSNHTQIPTDQSLLWVKLHMLAGNLLEIQGFTTWDPQAFHSQHSQSRQHKVEISTLACQAITAGLHEGNTEKNCLSCHTHSLINTPNIKLQFKKSKIPLALISSSSKHKALQWRPVLTEHDQLLSQAENASVTPWHFFLWSFQSFFHQRKNMHDFKFLPLKSYPKMLLGWHSSRSGKWPWSCTPVRRGE